ncbi:universal stress protein [Nocardiopsis metallicus]|uniref:Nucleotide-binding universal stress UspA family protein n=1 Tax=Nocardiopsis metallicus TaxID=179819 RepID=A0A840WFF1_9ACTN|nr:universal stress protein [Nocardiopsis metallicus]MBB5495700.1 nucleotide-binding universal stress UspA family protein [Nocardiopsis metallicus]
MRLRLGRQGHPPWVGPSAIERLLVPLDGSREAASALEPALRIARTLQVPMELLTVYDQVNGRWCQNIDDIAADLPYEHLGVSVVGSGWAGDVIVNTVAEEPGTVVCMSTHNRDRFSRLVAGSVTEHVLHRVSEPVLMVGPCYRPDETGVLFERAVVCQDGGPRDAVSLVVAENWAHQLKLELELVHACLPPTARSEASLSAAAKRLEERGLAARDVVVDGEDPAQSLIELFEQRPGAMAVLTSRARVGLPKFVLGSVSSKVLEYSPIPLLIIRAP